MKIDRMIYKIMGKDIAKFNTEIQEEMNAIADSVSTILDLALRGHDTDNEDEFRRIFRISNVEVTVSGEENRLSGARCCANIEVVMKPGSPFISVKRSAENEVVTYVEHKIDDHIIKTPKKRFDKLLEKVKKINPYYAHKCMPASFEDMVFCLLLSKLNIMYSIKVVDSYEFPTSYEGDTITFGVDFVITVGCGTKDRDEFSNMVLSTKGDI